MVKIKKLASSRLSVYVHWPFCVSKCPYCDFNSHVATSAPNVESWLSSYMQAIDAFDFSECTIETIYFGGGTPSLMDPELVRAIISKLKTSSKPTPDWEVTLEVNPIAAELEKLEAFRDAGVNRVSIGLQSLNNERLRFLGRAHDKNLAILAAQRASKIFGRYSLDLMYALPGQTADEWRQELREVLTLTSGHISLYQLMVCKGTPFYTSHRAGEWSLPHDDICYDMYQITEEETAKFGMRAYEVSNYAIPGEESRHNLAYWNYRDYLGIGPGAHSRLHIVEDSNQLSDPLAPVKIAAFCKYDPRLWMASPASFNCEILSEKDIINETLIMGLRLTDGLSKSRFKEIVGRDFEDIFEIKSLAEHLDLSGTHIKIRNIMTMDMVLRDLIFE